MFNTHSSLKLFVGNPEDRFSHDEAHIWSGPGQRILMKMSKHLFFVKK